MSDPYLVMCEHAHENGHLWCVWPDGVVTSGRSRPSREQRIKDYMSIPIYVCSRNEAGHAVHTGPTYATREEAERAVGPMQQEEAA